MATGYEDPDTGLWIFGEDDLADEGGGFSEVLNKNARRLPGAVHTLVVTELASDPTIAEAAAEAVGEEAASRDLVEGDDERLPQPFELQSPFEEFDQDSNGYVIRGLRENGVFYFRRLESPDIPVSDGLHITTIEDVPAWDSTDETPDGQIIAGRRTNGERFFHAAHIRRLRVDEFNDPRATDVDAIAGFADSMLADHGNLGTTTLKEMATALGVPYFDGAVGGQTSTEWAIRAVGTWLTGHLDGNAIPAGISPVAVTQVGPLEKYTTGSAWTFAMDVLAADGVTWVPGTLAKATDDSWTFTRLSAGSSVPVPTEVVFRSRQATTHQGWAYLIREGGINLNLDRIIRDFKAVRSWVYRTQQNPRLIILPVYNSYATAPAGSSAYVNTYKPINDALEREFPTEFYDLRRWMIHHGLAAAGITPTSDDTAAIAADSIPPSLALDSSPHITLAGRQIEGAQLAYVARSRGWFTQ